MKEDLNDVVVFIHVVEHGGFTAASRILDLPKSSVSRKVSRLEDRLGIRLLQRTTRKLVLTDAGRMFYDHGSRIVTELREAEQAVMHLRNVPRGLLRFTAPVETGPHIIPLLAEFMELYPEVMVDVDLTNRYVDMIAEGYDVAIRAARVLPESQLMARRLNPSITVLVASPEYLERAGEPVHPEDLSNHQCILFPRWTATTNWTLMSGDELIHVPVKGSMGVNNLEAARYAAVSGLGIATLPEEYCLLELEEGRLKRVLPQALPRGGNLWVVHPERRYPTPKVRAWVDFLVERFSLSMEKEQARTKSTS